MQEDSSGFVFIDVETTGLDPSAEVITEIAAVSCSPAGDVQQSFSSLVHTFKKIPDDVQALTGITPALLSSRGKDLGSVLGRVAEMVSGREMVAYNASFDYEFLRQEASRSGVKFSPAKVTCALEAARMTWPVLKRHRLTDVATYLGVKKPSHRAMPDCLTGLEVYLEARNASKPDELIATPDVAISKIDIENASLCEDGEELDLWTKPNFHSINAYRPHSEFGQGFVVGMRKDHPSNKRLVYAMQDGPQPYITVRRPRERTVFFTLHIFGG